MMNTNGYLFNGAECRPRLTRGACIERQPEGELRLAIPAGPAGAYRLAQLDDTQNISRRDFRWQVPFTFSLRARVSAANLPGTWGFGLWNDPFSLSLGRGGGARRAAALPNAAWFFHASPPNDLSLRDDLPGSGFLMVVFSSPLTPAILFAPAALALPLLAWNAAARVIRRDARKWIRQDAALLTVDTTLWHAYRLECRPDGICFFVDGELAFETPLTPRGRLGLVIWIDNQYAAFTLQGEFKYGTLVTPEPAWLEIDSFRIYSGYNGRRRARGASSAYPISQTPSIGGRGLHLPAPMRANTGRLTGRIIAK
jgi:hypothetical protein